jgi:rubrerythrin
MHADEHSEAITRAEAIFKGALATGAVFGVGAIGPYVRKALAFAGDNDPDTLNLLLFFEYVQAQFYEEGQRRLVASRELKEMIPMLGAQERAHAELLTRQIENLGGKPIPKDYYAVFAYREQYVETFLEIGWQIETNAVGAYNGAIPLLKSKQAKRLASSIAQVDARHAAALSLQDNEEPAPEAFDPVRSEFQALNSLIRFTGPNESPSLWPEKNPKPSN